MNPSLKEHWNAIYTRTPVERLSWYEAEPAISIELIERCAVAHQAPLVDMGSGASTLIPRLLELGYENLYAVDISEAALEKARAQLEAARAQLGAARAGRVHWLVEDVTRPSALLQLRDVAVWHDRAVFHFLTEEGDRQTYHAALQNCLAPGGFVILAAFALDGAPRCSGLPVQRQSVESLAEFLGGGFTLVESLDYTYQMPSGDLRPYVYARFQKKPLRLPTGGAYG